MINKQRRKLLTTGTALLGAAALPISALAEGSHSQRSERKLADASTSSIAAGFWLNVNDIQVVFADLHPGLVNLSTTNPPKILAGNAGGLAKVATALSIPMTFLTVPQNGKPGELLPELRPYATPQNTIFRTNADPFQVPEIVHALAEKKRKTLIVAGYITEVAVLFATLGALRHGYHVQIPVDCIGSSSARTEVAALGQMERAGAVQTSVLSIAAELAPDFSREPGTTILSVISDIQVRSKGL